MKKCPWCKFKKEGCKVEKDCDFKKLPYEKEAILVAMKKEASVVERVREDIVKYRVQDAEKSLAMVIDVSVALGIMADALIKDFGMSMDEIKASVTVRKLSLAEQSMLVVRVASMKKMR